MKLTPCSLCSATGLTGGTCVNDSFTQSEAVQMAAYECQWYQHSKMMKHYLLMIMARSQKAVQLTAYHFYIISLQTFGKVQYLLTLLLKTKQKEYNMCRTLSTDLRIVL
jgi:hypothetical protein